jgi:hypothetical protein
VRYVLLSCGIWMCEFKELVRGSVQGKEAHHYTARFRELHKDICPKEIVCVVKVT